MEKHITSNVNTVLLLLEKQSKYFLEILMLLFRIAKSFSRDKVWTRLKITLRSQSTRSSKIKICKFVKIKTRKCCYIHISQYLPKCAKTNLFQYILSGKKSWGKVAKFFASD